MPDTEAACYTYDRKRHKQVNHGTDSVSGWEEGWGDFCWEWGFPLGQGKCSRTRQRGWLDNTVNVLDATELCTVKRPI